MSDAERPDHRSLLEHLHSAAFRLGEFAGRWRLIKVTWPHVQVAVSAALRVNAPSEYAFRFECSGFPKIPATATLWDADENAALPVAQWPGGQLRVPSVFRPDWKNGACPYLPCDRESIAGHDNWRTQYPAMLWSEATGLVGYLEVLSELLTSADYSGFRGA